MKRILFILAISLCCAGVARAQYYGNNIRQIYSINWQPNIPVGDSRDFVSLVGLLELGSSFKRELQGFYISFYNVS